MPEGSALPTRQPDAQLDDSQLDARLDARLVLSIAIKAADIGHVIKPWALHHKWTLRVYAAHTN